VADTLLPSAACLACSRWHYAVGNTSAHRTKPGVLLPSFPSIPVLCPFRSSLLYSALPIPPPATWDPNN
jgi:hypothetical protein